MAVTPDDMLEGARERLATASTEVEYRSVTTDVYYAVFHYLMNHPACAAFQPTKDRGVHQQLIDFLKTHQNRKLQIVGRRLPRLRALRNSADYAISESFTKHFAIEALERVDEIIDELLPLPVTVA